MSKVKYINSKKIQKELFNRTEGYAERVRLIYLEYMLQLVELSKGTELIDDVPFSFKEYGYSDEATAILKKMYSSVYQEIRGDITKEWMLSNNHNDNLVKAIFGDKSIENNHYARFFQHNKEAMNAFFARKSEHGGLNLSQKVWKYTGQFKEELETVIDLAIGEGTGANKLATKVQEYLQDPDRYYRKFRVKKGEDKSGDPVYARVWKRRQFDPDTNSYKWVNDSPKKHHPGRGVYRSSYRNAQRLVRTETNIAYRTAEFERWQQLDFITGFEIRISNNPNTCDVCISLVGIYPKDFKWTGWHPNCRCHMVPIMAKEEDLDKMIDEILSNDNVEPMESPDAVTDLPDEFQSWIKKNKERMEEAEGKGTLPYFIKDNKKAVEDILKPLTPEQKYHKGLVDKYGDESVKQLYGAFDMFKEKISTGDLPFQIKKLNFEINWVSEKNKFPTSPEMVKMLEKELAAVQSKHDLQIAIEGANSVLGFKSKSSSLKDIYVQLQEALNESNTQSISDLTQKASDKIAELEKARIKRAAKKSINDTQIDLWLTTKEREQLAMLQLSYDDMFAKIGSQWDSQVNSSYRALAAYKKDLAEKYMNKQGKLSKLLGETESEAAKALAEYKGSTPNKTANTPVGGIFNTDNGCSSGDWERLKNFSKVSNIPADDLSLVTRYTYGSKWCNNWGYNIVDSYFSKVNDYDGLCQKYYPAMNSVLEKLPRYEGKVFSGVRMDSAMLDKYISELKECLSSGEPFVNKAFMSSTTNIESTTMFGKDVMLVIKSKHGADLKKVTHAPYVSEDEILFRGGSRFKVVSISQETAKRVYGYSPGSWVVQLEEI